MNPKFEEVKDLLLTMLGHDRWNSSLSDDRLAEKIASTLAGQGLFSAQSVSQGPRA
jgi:hypothetical protein